jgi:hypothetical protein
MNPTKLVSQFSDFFLFSTQFTRNSQRVLLFELTFCSEAPGKNRGFECGPWAAGRRGSGQIPAGPAAGPVGEGPGRSTRSPGSPWVSGFGRRGGRRGSSAVVAGASRGGRDFRRGRANSGNARKGRLPRGPREAYGSWDGDGIEGKINVHLAAPMAAGGGHEAVRGGRCVEGE